MPPAFDLVLRGGRLASADGVVTADLGVRGGRIAAVGLDLPAGAAEVDARGQVVTPGGVDPHCHIDQLTASGLRNADSWESATGAAALGGTTTVIPFVAQFAGESLAANAEDYHARAAAGAITDYALHLIVTDPRPEVLGELPALVAAGHASFKLFMTYDRLRIDDEGVLDVMAAARELGALVCLHAENHGMIAWAAKRLLATGQRAPRFHGPSHPRLAEADAIARAIAFSRLVDQPVMIFHVSTAEGAALIHAARGEGVKVWGETCTQYLLLTEAELDRPGVAGAKWICSPPLRTDADRAALWRALEVGGLQAVSSDHAPYRMDASGKLARGPDPSFKEIANGLPGIELRLPLLFDAMVSQGALDLPCFVELTATAPARLYGLHPRKGTLAIGADADLVLWDPARTVTIADAPRYDGSGYTPYAGRTVSGWPHTVLRRGEVIAQDGRLVGRPGDGRFLPRQAGPAAAPPRAVLP